MSASRLGDDLVTDAPAFPVLQREVTSGMRLLGATSIKELKPEMVELLDGLLGRKL